MHIVIILLNDLSFILPLRFLYIVGVDDNELANIIFQHLISLSCLVQLFICVYVH